MLKKILFLAVVLSMVGLMLPACGPTPTEAPAPTEAPPAPPAEETIKIGFDIPLTGDIPKVGEGSKYAGEMMLEKINGAGGLDVGGKKYQLEFIYEDNESKAESATAAALKLITTDKVLAIVGPQSSKQAVPTGEVAQTNRTPMISPWSTNPRTTKDRPYVFRACFLDPFQGPVAAGFATDEFGATKAAVLYDVASDYPKGLAEFFKAAFEDLHGAGSVVAFETFTTKDRDFSAQLTKIVASDADILFTPQYYDEVPLIVKQAHELGWEKPILGSDSWGSAELMNLCGDDCKGSFFSTHYAAAGAKGATKEFIDAYNAQYGYVPDDVAALTWDALGILLQAIQNTGGLTGDLEKDREAVKDELGKIADFDGITGKMSFTPDGDPIKCAVIVKISDAGEFEFYKSACPPEEAAVAPTELEEGPPIKIGFDIPLTGDIPKVGEGSKFAGEMMLEKVNGAGGLVVGSKQHKLEFVYEDNESKAESATAAALKLITTDKVLAIVGPQASKQAVPTGEIAETNMTPMISPWSTNPRTTEDRPYVFRACFLDPFQGPVAANFATDEFGATKAAVLYDVASDYPKGLAEFFKAAFEDLHGAGSVVAFETFTTKDRDFSAQLTKIVASDADILFTPQYYDEVPLIVKQAHELGWEKPILGSDSWGSAELMTLCGDDCKGSFFSTHYAAAGAKGATKEFIDAYNAQYGYVPDDVAALTWDAMGILLQAIQNTGGLTGDLEKDREAVKDELGKIADFDGITGKMSFTPDGDPIKCAVIVKISDAGEFEFYKSACP